MMENAGSHLANLAKHLMARNKVKRKERVRQQYRQMWLYAQDQIIRNALLRYCNVSVPKLVGGFLLATPVSLDPFLSNLM
jgi:hypothetical protein